MATDTNTRVIIDVSLNSQDATQKANDLGKSIKAVKEEQKALKAEGKENDVAYQSNAQNLRLLVAEQKAYIQIANSADGANNQLRAQLALLTAQYNALSKEERENTVAGKALTVQINDLSKEIKTNEERVGDHRRSVGDYAKANRDATATLQEQKQELGGMINVSQQSSIGFKLLGQQATNVTNQIRNFRQATQESRVAQQEFARAQQISTEATRTANELTDRATQIGFKFAAGQATAAEVELANAAAKDAFTVATAAQTAATEAQTVATGAATNATKVFKVALASTGIGAIIVLVAGLISYLSKFDPVMDKIEQAFSAVGAVVTRVTGIVVDFFRNIQSLGDFLSKMGDIILHPIDSFSRLSDSMSEAARAAINLKKAQQDLEDQQKIQEVVNAKAIQQIQQLTLQSRNRALSEKERQNLLKEAAKIDEQNFKERTEIANKEKQLAIDQIAITANLNARERKLLEERGLEYAFELKDRAAVTDAEVDALKQAELNRIEILTESTNRQEKIQNRIDQEAERAAQEEERRQARLKAAREKAQDAEQARLDSLMRTNAMVITAMQNEQAEINRDIDQKVAKYKEYGATTEQLEKERLARLQDLMKRFNKENSEIIKANQREIEDIIVGMIKNEGDRRLAQLKLNQDRALEAIDKEYSDIQERIDKGEKDLDAVRESIVKKRAATEAGYSAQRKAIVEEDYAADLERYNQHLVDLAQAEVLAAGTESEKLAAQQNLLNAQYQMEIDNAIQTGQDTTLITAEYENQKQELQEETIAAAFDGFKRFSSAFQGMVKENSTAYRIAGAIQAKVDAAQALRNNVLIVQENIKALSSQGKLLFPYNIIAIASTLAALASAVASAKTLVAPVAFETGGVFESDGRGAVLPGYSKRDNTNALLRSGEAVIVSEATRDPKALAALSAINVAYGGRPLAPSYAMAQGGFVSDVTDSVRNTQIANADIVNLVVTAIRQAPAPVVSVREIVSAQQTMQAAQVRMNL